MRGVNVQLAKNLGKSALPSGGDLLEQPNLVVVMEQLVLSNVLDFGFPSVAVVFVLMTNDILSSSAVSSSSNVTLAVLHLLKGWKASLHLRQNLKEHQEHSPCPFSW